MTGKYRAVATLKGGEGEDDIERGEYVTAGDVGGEEDLQRLVASTSVLPEYEFEVAFPGFDDEGEDGANLPSGTPSNMEQVEGTKLQSKAGEDAAVAEAELAGKAAADKAKAAVEKTTAAKKQAQSK